MKNILVFGATGPQGRPVAEKLLAAGYTVRALVRDRAKAQDLAQAGVEIVVGDMDDSAAVDGAMQGQDGVFLLVSFLTGRIEQARNVISAAARHGIGKLVWNATGTIPAVETGNPAMDMRREVLALLEASGIPFVALQPTVYMENFLIPAIAAEVAQKGVLAYPMPEVVRCQWISHLDAASFAVAAFVSTSDTNLVIDICGPEKLSGPQIAEGFSRGLGRAITFRPMPPEEFARAISFGGNEGPVIAYYQSVFADPSNMTTNVDYARAIEALPTKPTSVEDFARMHKNHLSSE